MGDNDRETRERTLVADPKRGKRPISLWIISVYLILSGLFAFILSWQAPVASSLAKLLGVASALVQAGSGVLLLLGLNLGRRLYLFVMPVIILMQALYLGSVMGFTDDDFPIRGLSPFLVYGVVAFLLMRGTVKTWLAGGSQSFGGS